MSNFVDHVRVFCRSGHGGGGAMHLRREKFVPMGGPDGGNGGRGGHVILRGSTQVRTLLHLRYSKHIHAEDGIKGSGALCNGADGKDSIINVPMGTIVKDGETGDFILEITEQGEEKILVHGGRGGKGNAFFKTSTNQTPRYAQPGEPHQEGWFVFELKLLADVGLVGFPNAGKSTLLSVVSAAKPEIADYPFTTLQPNLGIVKYRDHQSFVMADIPGIIEDAHKGKGLGLRFLRHIERNSVLLFLIPADSKDHANEYRILLNELTLHNNELLHKKRIIAISKSDMLDDELRSEISRKLLPNIPHIFFSSATQQGLTELKDELFKTLHES